MSSIFICGNDKCRHSIRTKTTPQENCIKCSHTYDYRFEEAPANWLEISDLNTQSLVIRMNNTSTLLVSLMFASIGLVYPEVAVLATGVLLGVFYRNYVAYKNDKMVSGMEASNGLLGEGK